MERLMPGCAGWILALVSLSSLAQSPVVDATGREIRPPAKVRVLALEGGGYACLPSIRR